MLWLRVGHERWCHHALTNDKEARWYVVLSLFLLPDNLFNGGRTAATVSRVPANTGPARIVLTLLPELRHFQAVHALDFVFRRNVCRKPIGCGCTKRCLFGSIVKIHD